MSEMVKENRGQISAVDQIAQFEGSATNPRLAPSKTLPLGKLLQTFFIPKAQ